MKRLAIPVNRVLHLATMARKGARLAASASTPLRTHGGAMAALQGAFKTKEKK